MTNEEFKHLREGDIVRAKASGISYVICVNYGRHVSAVRTIDITNPEDFDVIEKAAKKGPLDLSDR
jgi:hypothetical protein